MTPAPTINHMNVGFFFFITWICVDQNLRRYIAWLGHNEFRPKADFRIVLGSLKGLVDRIRWVTANFLDLVSLASPPSY